MMPYDVDARSVATVNDRQSIGAGSGGIKEIVLRLEERRRSHLSQGNFDAATLVDEQLHTVKTDELRRRLQQLDGQQAASLLHSESQHQQHFLHLQTEWEEQSRDFDAQAKRRLSDLDHKHQLELCRLEQEQSSAPHTAARKYSGRVLQLEDQQKRLIRIRRYSEAKAVLSTVNELKRRQKIQFEQARKKSQELERSHLLKAQSRERKVQRGRLQDERQKLLVAKRETIELCVRRHQAQLGRIQHRNQKQKAKLQDDLRIHLGLHKSAAASVAARASEPGMLKGTGRVSRPQSAISVSDSARSKRYGKLLGNGPSNDQEFNTMFRWSAHTGLPESSAISCPLDDVFHAGTASRVRYGEGATPKPQRPVSAPVRRQGCMQPPKRPHSAFKQAHRGATRAGHGMCGSTPREQHRDFNAMLHTAANQSKWQGKSAYRHKSTAIQTKLAKQRNRPQSAI